MVNAKTMIIGSRKSELAMAQALIAKNQISYFLKLNRVTDVSLSIEPFTTSGDIIIDRNLSEIGGKGLFTKEIEEALIARKITFAVHSMKDMPATYPDQLAMGAVLTRDDPRDAFISLKYKSIDDLPKNAVIGTSSTRRKAFLLKKRPDLKIVNFRGNVNTRLSKLENGEVDATILAVCGLRRINMERYISDIIEIEDMLPAVGQGVIGIQHRIEDKNFAEILSAVNHSETEICIKAERAFLAKVGGSCKMPIAGYCQIIEKDKLLLRASVSSLDGSKTYQMSKIGSFEEAESIGSEVGDNFLQNAQHILKYL